MKDSIVSQKASLQKILQGINARPSGICFVVNEAQQLCGVVTDGDFRRWLLEGYELDTLYKELPHKAFVYAFEGEKVEEVIARTDEKIRVVPIVNQDFHLVDYLQIDKRIHMPVAMPDLFSGNELKYLNDAFLSSWISSSGKYINQFEECFAGYCGSGYGVAVSNGTVAIHLALKALDIGPGDEVIVPDFTFAATINAVIHAGATPVIVDVDQDDWCIGPEAIKKSISDKTKAVIAVHIYGQPCKMHEIMSICERNNLKLIEDCAEAHGATYDGKRVGSFGVISTFSFFANKIVTTGEGGMCLTSSEKLNERLRVLRDHGMSKEKRYWHEEVGFNYRMTNMQAAIGCAQMERIERILQKRKQLEITYKDIFSEVPSISFQKDFVPLRNKTIWLITALYKNADAKIDFMDHFKRYEIDLRPVFYPLSAMPVYQKYSVQDLPVSKHISQHGLSFPTYLDIDFDKIRKAVDGLPPALR